MLIARRAEGFLLVVKRTSVSVIVDSKANHFQERGPKYGIAYFQVFQNSHSFKKIHDRLLQALSQADDYPALCTLSGQIQHIDCL